MPKKVSFKNSIIIPRNDDDNDDGENAEESNSVHDGDVSIVDASESTFTNHQHKLSSQTLSSTNQQTSANDNENIDSTNTSNRIPMTSTLEDNGTNGTYRMMIRTTPNGLVT